MIKRTAIAAILILVVFCVALLLAQGTGLTGSDDKAVSVIQEINPDFQPWMTTLWEGAEENEGLLFAIQATLGASFIGYYFVRLGGSRTSPRERGY